jgi:transcriptional regulator with XRE-family HTH domain
MTEQELAELVGRNVRAVRESHGKTQSQVEAATGIAVPHLSRLEAGKGLSSLKTLLKLANYFGVNVCAFVEQPKGRAGGKK